MEQEPEFSVRQSIASLRPSRMHAPILRGQTGGERGHAGGPAKPCAPCIFFGKGRRLAAFGIDYGCSPVKVDDQRWKQSERKANALGRLWKATAERHTARGVVMARHLLQGNSAAINPTAS